MTWLSLALAFAAGVAAGRRLSGWLGRWREFRQRRGFRPVVLEPYRPDPRQGGGKADTP
ncbi:MAG: hypothetical protein ACM3VY_00650 [Candidatus Bathyarchaeota archaeon]